jgi:ABC-2 type transport system ATP-binding protein
MYVRYPALVRTLLPSLPLLSHLLTVHSMSLPILEVQDLSQTFHRTGELFKNLSFSLPANSITGVIGPNGVGKSTLLHILAGLAKPTTGTVRLGNKAVPVGIVADQNRFYQFLNVEKTLRLASTLSHRWNAKIANALVKDLGLPLERRCRTLSRGENIVLQFIIEFSREVDYLVIDEGFSALDFDNRLKILHYITTEYRSGRIVIFTTHDYADVSKMADYILELRRGSDYFFGKSEDYKSNYRRIIVKDRRLGDVIRGRLAVLYGEEIGEGYALFVSESQFLEKKDFLRELDITHSENLSLSDTMQVEEKMKVRNDKSK